MKTKSFRKYLKKRLNKEEIAEIEAQADLEIKILQSIQKATSFRIVRKKNNKIIENLKNIYRKR